MKLLKRLFLSSLLVFCILHTTTAQSEELPNVFSAGVGFSLVGNLLNTQLAESVSNAQVSTFSRPVLFVTYDRHVASLFSVGAAFSLQEMGIDFANYEYTDPQGNFKIEDFSIRASRRNFAVRGLVHFLPNQDEVDLYTGVRFGMTQWAISGGSSDPDFSYAEYFKFVRDNLEPTFWVSSLQWVVLGARVFPTENFGAGVEFSLGAPYYFSLALNGRF